MHRARAGRDTTLGGQPSHGTVRLLSPGLVDITVTAEAAFSYDDPDPHNVRSALTAHRRHGTSTIIVSLVTHSPEMLHAQVRALRELVRDGELAGVHLEGPCLEPRLRRRTVVAVDHRPPGRRPPRPGRAPGVQMVTLAPELPEALETIA